MDAVRFLSTLAREAGGKVADHRVANACGVQPRTVTAWRYGERRVPAHLLADLRRMRRDRAAALAAHAAAELRRGAFVLRELSQAAGHRPLTAIEADRSARQ